MEGRAACAPQLAESGAQNNIISSPHAVSVTGFDKVINNKTDSTQGEGEKSEEELLQGLLTDQYCHVCEAVLLFKSQRLAHYEGKRHAQKLKVYLQAKRSERTNTEPTGLQQSMAIDKDRFCELCNMVFSSPVVARSHYEGKVHTKNLRKQGLQPQVTDKFTEVHNLPSLSRDPSNAVQKTGPEDGMEPLDPTATTITPTEVDLKDPNKHCALCAASFNNPQMALQHYNGRKHQKNQNRQELLQRLGDDTQQADSLLCKMCKVQFNSSEMYQAHMKGNKHHIREKKVTDLCKSQQKAYSTFTDELSDYIQIQKARGITPRPQVLPSADTKEEDEEDEEEEVLTKDDVIELSKPMPNLPPHPSRLGFYNPFEGWRPPYQGSPWPSHGVNYSCPPPVVPGSSSPLLPSWPIKRGHRKQLGASSNITSSSHSSSYSSSYSSSTCESDNTEYRRREKRRIRRSRKGREKRGKDEDSDKEGKGNHRRRRDREKDSEGRRRGESGESEEERRRKKLKNYSKQGRGIKKPRVEDLKVGERMMDNLMPEDITDKRKPTEVHIQTEMNVDLGDGGQDELARNKYRRDKKKTKEKVDTRTEEEKLWDDSILGF